jgi:hypothetical protein
LVYRDEVHPGKRDSMRALQNRHLAVAVGTAFLALFTSCESSRWYEHRFQPAPLESEVATQAIPGAQVRALVTVIGIERGKDGLKDRALVRMRLENIGSVPAKLAPDSLSLLTADLRPFGAASVEPPEPKDLAPGSNATVDCVFPLPEGPGVKGPYDLDLSGLNLRFTVVFGEKKVTTGMTFQRTDWGYWDPGYSRVHVGVGVGWSQCN